MRVSLIDSHKFIESSLSSIFQKTIAFEENSLFICNDDEFIDELSKLFSDSINFHDENHIVFQNNSSIIKFNNGDQFIPPIDNVIFIGSSYMEEIDNEWLKKIDKTIFDPKQLYLYILDDLGGKNEFFIDFVYRLMSTGKGWMGFKWKIKKFFRNLFKYFK